MAEQLGTLKTSPISSRGDSDRCDALRRLFATLAGGGMRARGATTRERPEATTGRGLRLRLRRGRGGRWRLRRRARGGGGMGGWNVAHAWCAGGCGVGKWMRRIGGGNRRQRARHVGAIQLISVFISHE